jgi:hypothetical protein
LGHEQTFRDAIVMAALPRIFSHTRTGNGGF